jgi:hypothetical protein
MADNSLFIQHSQHGGGASIYIVCATAGKLRISGVFLQDKNVTQNENTIIKLPITVMMIITYLHVPLAQYVTAVSAVCYCHYCSMLLTLAQYVTAISALLLPLEQYVTAISAVCYCH